MALGLCLIWGYGGALSFGQTAFFGIAGYAYGVLTLNFGAAYGFTLGGAARRGRAVGAVRRRARLFPVLRPHQRRLPRHRHAVGDAGPRALHGADGRARMAHRRGAAQRLQRHERHAAADHPLARRRADRARSPMSGSTISCSALLVLVYLGAAHPGELVVRQRARRDPRESRARRDARLRRAQIPARRLRHRRRARRPERRALHGLGPVHHAVQHGHDGGRAADRLGRGRRPQRPDRDAARHAGRARRLSRR